MRVKFLFIKEQVAEVKLDAPPREGEYVTFYDRGKPTDYRVISVRHIYSDPTPGTYSIMFTIVHVRTLVPIEEEHVKLSRPE